MKQTILLLVAVAVIPALASAQSKPAADPPAPVPGTSSELADSLAERLGKQLHVKTAVGEAMKVGSVTLIPIMIVDVSFGGGAMIPPEAAKTPPSKPIADSFYLSGEVRPLGFVAVTKKGTRFISVGKTRIE